MQNIKQFQLGDRLFLVYAIPITVTILSAADRYLEISGLIPLSMYVISLLSLLPIFLYIVFRSALLNRSRELINIYSANRRVIFSFGALALVVLIGAVYPDAYFDRRGEFLKPFIMFLVLLFSISMGTIPDVVRHHRKILGIGFCCLVGSVIFDIISPGTFSITVGRPGGLSLNPGVSAILLVLLTIGIADWQRLRFYDLICWFVSFSAVFCTLARSGLLLWMICFTWYILKQWKNREIKVFHVIGGLFLLGLMLIMTSDVLLMLQETTWFESQNAQRRIDFIANISELDADQLRAEDRVWLLQKYMGYVFESPIIGHGTGFSHGTGHLVSHNLFVHYWAENGLIGLMVVLWFLGATAKHFQVNKDYRSIVVLAAIIVAGIVWHNNLFEHRSIVMLLGLLASVTSVNMKNLEVEHEDSPVSVSPVVLANHTV